MSTIHAPLHLLYGLSPNSLLNVIASLQPPSPLGEHHNQLRPFKSHPPLYELDEERHDVVGAFSQQRAEWLVDCPSVYRLFVAASQSSRAAAGRETAKRTAAVYNTSLPATAGGYIEP